MKPLILLLASFIAANAATITTTTTCTSGPTVVYGSTRCSAVNGSVTLGPVIASSSTGYEISGNELSIHFDQSVFASGTNGEQSGTNPVPLQTSSIASSIVSFELDTSGPMRSGYAAVLMLGLEGGENEGGSALSINGAGYSIDCDLRNDLSTCGLPSDLAVAEAYGYKPAPITLGSEFSFSVGQETYAFGNSREGGSASRSSVVALELFDTDGVTPVNIFGVVPVPEPASAGLVILFIFALMAYLLVRFAASDDRFPSALERFTQLSNERESQ